MRKKEAVTVLERLISDEVLNKEENERVSKVIDYLLANKIIKKNEVVEILNDLIENDRLNLRENEDIKDIKDFIVTDVFMTKEDAIKYLDMLIDTNRTLDVEELETLKRIKVFLASVNLEDENSLTSNGDSTIDISKISFETIQFLESIDYIKYNARYGIRPFSYCDGTDCVYFDDDIYSDNYGEVISSISYDQEENQYVIDKYWKDIYKGLNFYVCSDSEVDETNPWYEIAISYENSNEELMTITEGDL